MFFMLSDLKEIKISAYIPLDPNFVFVCRIINEYKVSSVWPLILSLNFSLRNNWVFGYIIRSEKVGRWQDLIILYFLFCVYYNFLFFSMNCSMCVLLISRIILGDCQGTTSLFDIPWRYESVPMECIHVIQANCCSLLHCLNWDAWNVKTIKLMRHLL